MLSAELATIATATPAGGHKTLTAARFKVLRLIYKNNNLNIRIII